MGRRTDVLDHELGLWYEGVVKEIRHVGGAGDPETMIRINLGMFVKSN